jgi:ribosome-associated translation inhibitor RaiA
MKHKIEFKGFQQNLSRETELRKLIEDRASALEKRLKRFDPDEFFLRAVVDENPAHTLYHISIVLDVPEKAIAAKDEGRDPESPLRAAFTEIERQLDQYKASQRGEHQWKQRVRREELRLRQIEEPPDEQRTSDALFAIVQPHVPELERFARAAVAGAEARGDLSPAELTPEELMEATLLRGYREFARNPMLADIPNWLLGLAAKQLDAEIEQSRAERTDMAYRAK